MPQNALPFQYEVDESGATTGWAGLCLFAALFEKLGLLDAARAEIGLRQNGWDDGLMTLALALLNIAQRPAEGTTASAASLQRRPCGHCAYSGRALAAYQRSKWPRTISITRWSARSMPSRCPPTTPAPTTTPQRAPEWRIEALLPARRSRGMSSNLILWLFR